MGGGATGGGGSVNESAQDAGRVPCCALAERLLQATVREATASILTDPSDLPLDGDLVDDDGLPDTEKITEAAKALVSHKPHLALRRPTENVGQGARPESTPTSLVDLRGNA